MEKKNTRPTDHLANERTFLAWIRTSVAIMAFGFVVVKFALFVKQITFILGEGQNKIELPAKSSSAIIGISLVALGTIMTLFAFLRYKNVERQLHANEFFPSLTLIVVATIAIILVGLLLVIYLVPSV